jgi:ADP-heptose:LPS heptosyltransferase
MGSAPDYHTDLLRPETSLLSQIQKRLTTCSRPWVLIGAGGTDKNKRYPLERFSEIIRVLNEELGGTYFIFGGSDLKEDAEALLASINRDNVHTYSVPHERPNFAWSLALASLADMYVGNDCFCFNLAANVNIPSVVLFQRSDKVLAYRPNTTALVSPVYGHIDSIPMRRVIDASLPILQKKR